MNQVTENTNTEAAVEVKLSRKALKEQFHVEKDIAAEEGKTFETWAQYSAAYDAQWDLAHPNDKDALPTNVTVDQVLNTVNAAAGAVGAAIGTVKAEAKVSKMSLAAEIFKIHLDAAEGDGSKLSRKTILAQLQLAPEAGGAGCTKDGANTYYNTLRDKAGLVNHKS